MGMEIYIHNRHNKKEYMIAALGYILEKGGELKESDELMGNEKK